MPFVVKAVKFSPMKIIAKHARMAAVALALSCAWCFAVAADQPAAASPSQPATGSLDQTAADAGLPRADDGVQMPVDRASVSTAFPLVPAQTPSETASPAQPPVRNRALPAHVDTLRLQGRQTQAAAGQSEDLRPNAYSPNWLLDGVQRLEAEDRLRKGAQARSRNTTGSGGTQDSGRANAGDRRYLEDDEGLSREAEQGAVPNPGASANPLAAYLDKWLASSQNAAAMPGSTFAGPGAAQAYAHDWAGMPGSPFTRQSADGQIAAPAALPASNPYIDDLAAPLFNTTDAFTLTPPAQVVAPVAAPEVKSPPAPAGDVVAPAVPEPAATPEKQAPTRPLVNDRKYFPQLNRF